MTQDNRGKRSFDARLDLVPTEPGVYLMKDGAGQVIYVGKANSLRQRLRSYFAANPVGSDKVLAMIRRIEDFTYLVTQNELEALVLESNLIKRYQPFYNILLKDDHDYPYIKVTLQDEYPRVMKAYRVGDDVKKGARYYGPYLNGDLNRALRTIHQMFALKTCRRVFPRDVGKERPCLNYYIHRCVGPCLGTVSAEDYRAEVMKVCAYLEGRYDGIVRNLESQMAEASEDLKFEKAAVLRDRARSLRALEDSQHAVLDIRFDGDALGLAGNEAEVAVLKLEIRGGKVIGTSTFFLDAAASEPPAVLEAFIMQYYPTLGDRVPSRILLSETIPDRETLESYLAEIRGKGSVSLEVPQRGERRRVLEMAMENAAQALRRRTLLAGSSQTALDAALQYLGEVLELQQPPFRVEAFDISNMGTNDMACGMVVFENGRVRRNAGRLFNIKMVEGIDDYAAMREAVERRLNHLGDEKFGLKPDVILLDGGRGHVSTIVDLLNSRGIEDIAVAGMVKDARHRTRGLVLSDGRIMELAESIRAGDKETDLDAGSGLTITDQDSGLGVGQVFEEDTGSYGREHQRALLRLLAAIQNEAHRLANKQRQKMAKNRTTRFSLEDIPGVGPARRKVLMKAFASIKAIREASYEEILEHAPSLGPSVARNVWEHYHPEEAEQLAETEALSEEASLEDNL